MACRTNKIDACTKLSVVAFAALSLAFFLLQGSLYFAAAVEHLQTTRLELPAIEAPVSMPTSPPESLPVSVGVTPTSNEPELHKETPIANVQTDSSENTALTKDASVPDSTEEENEELGDVQPEAVTNATSNAEGLGTAGKKIGGSEASGKGKADASVLDLTNASRIEHFYR